MKKRYSVKQSKINQAKEEGRLIRMEVCPNKKGALLKNDYICNPNRLDAPCEKCFNIDCENYMGAMEYLKF